MGLEKSRKDIDSIDDQIIKLLNKRATLALEVGKEKRKEKKAVFDPGREREIIRKLIEENKGLFPKEAVESVFSEIFSASRQLQEPIKIAYLGPRTTFTHMAAIKKFGSNAKYIAKGSIKDVFNSVEKKEASYGTVPVENSTEGTVNHTLDMFVYSDLNIVAEISIEIKHHLLSKYKLSEIKKIYSHPQALAQCREWLGKNLPKAELIETSSTTKGAEFASLYHSSGAVASELAAKEFGLNIIAKNVQDNPYNITRFLVIGKAEPKRTGRDKTSIMFSVKHEAGSLFKALNPFYDNKINMTKIESRPTKMKTWEYVFFIDLQGFVDDAVVQKALNEMKGVCGFIKVLGSYPEQAINE